MENSMVNHYGSKQLYSHSLAFMHGKEKSLCGFGSGSTVRETEITDIPAYDRANGKMWIGFSLLLWLYTFIAL